MHPLVILLLAIIAVFVLIVRLKINAFVALIAAAIVIGVLAPAVAIQDVMSEVAGRFGRVVGGIGIPIAMAAVIGQCMMESGAADKITRRFIAWFGEKRSSLSLVASGYVLSVPVFYDTVFYLLVPLARSMTIRGGGRRYILNALAIGAGGSATHVFVPPTPGPLAMAETMQIDLGLVIVVGLLVAAPASLLTWLYCIWIDNKLQIPVREAPGLSLAELEEIAHKPESELPSMFASLLPVVLPIVMITSNTVAHSLAEGSEFARWAAFFGNPSFALMVAASASLWVLARQKGMTLTDLAKPAQEAIQSAGMIILITAGGGAFGGMLVLAGVGDVFGELAKSGGWSYIWLGFAVSVLLRIAQGSATVAMITVSAILAPIMVQAPPAYHPVYVLMAIGGGSLVGNWMNNSAFWVFCQMTGLTEVEGLKTVTGSSAVLGTAGAVVAWLGSILFPMV